MELEAPEVEGIIEAFDRLDVILFEVGLAESGLAPVRGRTSAIAGIRILLSPLTKVRHRD